MQELTIDGRRIADDTATHVIAEIGHDHLGSVGRANEPIHATADSGVGAIKLQKRSNRRSTSAPS